MLINKLKNHSSIIMKGLFIGVLCITSGQAFSFDLKAKYAEVNFTQIGSPTCGDESKYIPPLPKDPRARLYYLAAQRILGQDDIEHYRQMYILGDKAAQMGHWKAKLLMASLFLRNSRTEYSEFNPKKAKEYVMDLVKKNVPEAVYLMGQLKQSGMSEFIKDPIPVSVYMVEAAKLNNPKALTSMYDIFMSVGRPEDAQAALNCAIKQKQGTSTALYKMASVLEEKANTQKELEESLKMLYKAAKAGNYDAIASFPNKETYYKQQFGGEFFSKAFLKRMAKFQNAMNAIYTHTDPYRQNLGKKDQVRGNIFLTFPYLEKALPFPPTALPEWDGDISIALSPDYLKIYQTDFDYDQLVKEAQAIKIKAPSNEIKEKK